MPAKFIRCVKAVKKKGSSVNLYAVCRASTGFYGSTHHAHKKMKRLKRLKGGKK